MLIELGIFIFWLTLSVFMGYNTRDMVWSLWFSSLVTGYLTILSNLLAGTIFSVNAFKQNQENVSSIPKFIVAGLVFSLFYIGFFSFHFLGFHSIHSIFLQALLPLEGTPDLKSDQSVETIFFSIVSVTARTYWPIALCAIFFERNRIFGALTALFPDFKRDKNERNSPISETKKNPVASFIMAPYAAVARIHCLILVLGFLIIFYKNDSLLIFALSYILLFFPYKKFFEWITGKEDKK